MYNFFLAQVFGTIGIGLSVASMQAKKRKNILIILLLLNLASALNFLFLENLASVYICLFAMLEIVINYLFERKGRDAPVWLVGVYIAVNVLLGMISFTSLLDILPIISAVIFCLTILMKNEQTIRKMTLASQSVWLVFDVTVGAYMFSISNILTIISTIIALYRFKQGKKTHAKKHLPRKR